jgi:hypothetical protein
MNYVISSGREFADGAEFKTRGHFPNSGEFGKCPRIRVPEFGAICEFSKISRTTDGKSDDLRMNKCKKKPLPHQTVHLLPGILKLGDTRICVFVGTEEFSGLLFREVRTAGGEKEGR